MKKLLSSLVLVAALSFVACNNEKKADTAETKDGTEQMDAPTAPAAMMAAVAHVCTDKCTEGNHMYAHNEVGHTCTEACGAAHVCTEKCSEGNHMYAHGEAGHTCSEECTQM